MYENRIHPVIRPDFVTETLPGYFTTDYPHLVLFLQYYYESLDSDGGFGDILKDLYSISNIGLTDLKYLDSLFYELGLNVSKDLFKNPREVLRSMAEFFRTKGSEQSLKQFFRMFYNSEAKVSYPKDEIFLLNDNTSLLDDPLKKIQDGKLYQVLSLMITSPIGYKEYEELYKKFVHPAGFYVGALAQVHSDAIASPSGFQDPNIVDNSNKIFNEKIIVPTINVNPILKSDIGNSDVIVFDGQTTQGVPGNTFLHDYDTAEHYTDEKWFLTAEDVGAPDGGDGYQSILETGGHNVRTALRDGYHNPRDINIAALDPYKTLKSEDTLYPPSLEGFDPLAGYSIFEAAPNKIGIIQILNIAASSTSIRTVDLKSLWGYSAEKIIRKDSQKFITRAYIRGDFQSTNDLRIYGLNDDPNRAFVVGDGTFNNTFLSFTQDNELPVINIDNFIDSDGVLELSLQNTGTDAVDLTLVFAYKYNTIYDWIKYDSNAVFDINSFVYADNRNIRGVGIQEIMNKNILYLKDTII